MKYLIVNNLHVKPEPIIIFETNDDLSLIEFVKGIVKENGDEDYSILDISDATEYIDKYCDNLTFIDEAKFWELLGDVPVNEDDEIDIDFLIFDKGTDKFDIWHWFEETFETQIGGKYM